MEVSPPLRWLGALAIMLVVVLIVVPLLLQTIGDTVQLGGEPSEAPASEASAAASEAPTAEAAANDGGGGGDGGQDEDSGDDSSGGAELPTTYTVESGDTGSSISDQFYGATDGWARIAEANDIDPSAPLRVGAELEIPAPE